MGCERSSFAGESWGQAQTGHGVCGEGWEELGSVTDRRGVLTVLDLKQAKAARRDCQGRGGARKGGAAIPKKTR